MDPGAEHAHEVSVLDSSRERGLSLEARQALGVLSQEQLERDPAAELGVLGQIDDAHGASTELPQESVGPDLLLCLHPAESSWLDSARPGAQPGCAA